MKQKEVHTVDNNERIKVIQYWYEKEGTITPNNIEWLIEQIQDYAIRVESLERTLKIEENKHNEHTVRSNC